QDGEDEENADREENGRRVPAHPDPTGDRVQPAPPCREPRQRETREQPEQRVALTQPVAPDELEHDEDERERRDRAGDRDCERGHCDSSCGTTLRRKRPTKIASSTFTM